MVSRQEALFVRYMLNLWDAPFRKPLRILDLAFGADAESEARLVLAQLGVDVGEIVEKLHAAPLADPVSLKIGEQVFTLRREICRKVEVVLA
jgi:Fe2+ transport system protein FeoA